MKRPLTAFLGMLLLPIQLLAGTNTIYSFLRTDVSARAAALAGSFVTVTGDPNMLFYNIAGLGTVATPTGSAGFFKHLLDINSGYVSYSQPVEDIGIFGAGVVYTNYGSFTEMDEVGNTLGSFTANDLAFSVGYANTLQENLYYGVGLKFIYSGIADARSSGLAGDAGLLYTIPDSRLAFGVSIRNIGRQLVPYLSTIEPLPLDVTVGASVIPRGLPLLLNVNFHKLNDDVSSFGDRFRAFTIGGEFTLSKVVQARFGYNNEQRKDLKVGTSVGLEGFSGGIGITAAGYRFDYALSSLGQIGNLHRISIATNF